MPITQDKRGYVAGKFGLELDGKQVGWVQSAEGGFAVGEVVTEEPGPDHIAHKHLATAKYEAIGLAVGTGMSKDFYDWIKSSFERKLARKDGAVLAADYNYKEQSRLSFYNAILTEIGFPALDAASKDAAKMTVKFAPEQTRRSTAGKGGALANGALKGGRYGQLQKKWLPSNFRLAIDGLDCTRVNKMDEIVVRQKVAEDAVGELREYERVPTHLEIPNLTVTFAESTADPWYTWHDDFVVKGTGTERNGSLEYLTPNLNEVLFTLTFHNLGIFRLTPEKVEAGSENIRRVKAEMYCEEILFDYKAAWA